MKGLLLRVSSASHPREVFSGASSSAKEEKAFWHSIDILSQGMHRSLEACPRHTFPAQARKVLEAKAQKRGGFMTTAVDICI
jgi:hypothetical protein